MDRYDVVIIGTGAGGGTLARHLAPSGKRILLLERGDWLPREPQNWSAADVFIDNRYISADTWYDDRGKTFQPQVHYFVGGATKLYGAALYRLRRHPLSRSPDAQPTPPATFNQMSHPESARLRKQRHRGVLRRRALTLAAVIGEPRLSRAARVAADGVSAGASLMAAAPA
jgi:choline dehydrogenase-like flavoprotein